MDSSASHSEQDLVLKMDKVIVEEKYYKEDYNTKDKSRVKMGIRKYQKGRFLGKGGFAKCYEMTNLKTLESFAAKIFTKESLKKSRSKKNLLSEIKIHQDLDHKNIVGFKHFFEDSNNVYVLLEL